MKMVLGLQQQCGCGGVPARDGRVEGLETKSGILHLVQNKDHKVRKVSMYVRVYQNCFEHYMLIFKDQKYTNQAVFVNLKNSLVKKSGDQDNEFDVIPDNIDGSVFTFHTNSDKELESWLSVLQSVSQSPGSKGCISPTLSPVIPRAPLMPPLTEEDEEGD
ncbi:hypothetical protein FSP39_021175 [Pinctada imbricata]|uniref:PH domain-containing protein n=1 Tax=Pinctada imbricata TaxID=66713 RepID=A0AA89BRN7_PINIB|nr:hypothetical protein FSP39_021175 [Pinctada imbricata]